MFGRGVSQPALDFEDAAQRLILFAKLMILPEEGVSILEQELVALQQFLGDLLEGSDDCLVAVVRAVAFRVQI